MPIPAGIVLSSSSQPEGSAGSLPIKSNSISSGKRMYLRTELTWMPYQPSKAIAPGDYLVLTRERRAPAVVTLGAEGWVTEDGDTYDIARTVWITPFSGFPLPEDADEEEATPEVCDCEVCQGINLQSGCDPADMEAYFMALGAWTFANARIQGGLGEA